MAITMYQSDRNFVTPSDDRSLYSALIEDASGILNRGNSFAMSTNGLVTTIDTGQAIISGGLVEITDPEYITLPSNSSGHICIIVDLTRTNDVSGSAGDEEYNVTVNQVYVSAVSGSLKQEDLNNGGLIYDFPIATFTTGATGAVVTPIKTIVNDTGWLNLSLASGAKLISSDPQYYAKYRIVRGVVYVQINGVDVTKSVNGTSLFNVTSDIAPAFVLNENGTSYTGNGKQVGIGIVVQTRGVAYVNWSNITGSNGSHINAGFSYPLG